MKKFITAFLLAVFGISFFCSTAVPASAAVQPTASIVADGIYYIRNQRSGLIIQSNSENIILEYMVIMGMGLLDFKSVQCDRMAHLPKLTSCFWKNESIWYYVKMILMKKPICLLMHRLLCIRYV